MNLSKQSTPQESIDRLLALCARAKGHPLFYEQLQTEVREFSAWQELPAQAERYEVAPLLWYHLRQAEIAIPAETEQMLRGSYLRQRHATQMHTRVLLEVSELFAQAGIRAIVLKGLGLAYQIYPDPALRPISDVDLLLKRDDILPAREILADAGYRVDALDPSEEQLPWEVTADSPLRNGLRTHIELHYPGFRGRAQLDDHSVDDEFDGFLAPSVPLSVENGTIYLPDPLEHLVYISNHFARHLFFATEEKPVPLKWIADILSLAEHHAARLDWEKIKVENPLVFNQLAVFYALSPMPEHLQEIIPIQPESPPQGLNQYAPGWPAEPLFRNQRGIFSYIRQTFTPPSAWWLRLYYGIAESSVFFYGQFVYRWQILNRLFWIAVHRIEKRKKT